MKIGLSYSRCVLDIIEGRVDVDDVLIIICRTMFDPTVIEQWENIWDNYTYVEWFNHLDEEEKFKNLTLELYNNGKLHQPRNFGANISRSKHVWLETVLTDNDLDDNPAAKLAWEQFQLVAKLSNIKMYRS